MKITKETLQEVFQVDLATAEKAIKIIRGKVSDDELHEYDSVRQLYNYDREYAELLVLNEILDCFGVEAIGDQPNFIASYLNTGDTYQTTLVRFDDTGKYTLTSWGDVAEKYLKD